jgi:hypothetical protein
MAYIPCVNCLRVSLMQRFSGQLVVNTLSFLKGSAIVEADLTDAAAAGVSWWETYVKPMVSDQLSLEGVNVIDLTTSSSPSYNLAVSPVKVGARASARLSANAAVVISWRTPLRGRSFRGRFYVSGICEDTVSSATQINGTLQTGLLVAAANLDAFFDPLGLAHVVISRFADKAARSAGFPAVVTSAVVDVFIDSMRRRLENRGV